MVTASTFWSRGFADIPEVFRTQQPGWPQHWLLLTLRSRADCGTSGCIYRRSMRTPVKRAGRSVAVWLAVSLAAVGGVLLVASVLVAFLFADHSSSDSSASSVIAIGLGGLGFLAFVLSGMLLGVVVLARLWRRARRPVRGEPSGK
jgi:hypothetical protein